MNQVFYRSSHTLGSTLSFVCRISAVACFVWGSAIGIGSAVQAQTEPVVGLRSSKFSAHALTDARIVTGTGQVIESGTIIIRDGLIEQLGSQLSIPPDARRWDLKGRTVYPGMIDVFANLGMQDLTGDSTAGAAFWNRQIRSELDAAAIYVGDQEAAGLLRSQGITVAMLVPRSGIVRGQAAVISLNQGGPREQLLVNQQGEGGAHPQVFGFSRTGALGGGYPTSGMGTIALIRQVLLDAQWYAQAQEIFISSPNDVARPERNDSLAALERVVMGQQPVLFDTRDEQELLRAMKIADEFSLKSWIYGNGTEYRIVDQLSRFSLPLIIPINYPTKPDVSHPETSQQISLSQLRHWKFAPENPARLAAADVKFALTSDRSGKDFLKNVRLAVKHGLSSDAALAALTSYPAELLGLSKTHGTIESGKVANLVVVDGDLFDDKGRIHDVWVDGDRFEIYSPATIDPVGKWQVTVKAEDRLTGELSFRKRGNRWTGTWQKATLDSISFNEQTGRVRFIFPGESFELTGKIRASASIAGDDLQGWCELPDGRQIEWSAERVEQDQNSETKSEEGKEETSDDKKVSDDQVGDDGESQQQTEKVAEEESDSQDAQEQQSDDDNSETNIEGRSKKSDKPSVEPKLVRPFNDFGRAELPQTVDMLLVRNATIWSMGPEGKLENADLLVKQGKVVAVGKDLTAPASDCLVIDGTDKHLTPGLIDAHLHSGIAGGVNETGHAIVPEVRIGDVLDINTSWTYRQLAGGLTAAHVMHGSANPIGGQNQTLKLRWGKLPEELKIDDAPRTVKFALGENVIRRAGRYPDTRMGVEQIIRDNFQAAVEYEQRWKDWESNPRGIPPRRNLRLEALADIVRGDILIQTHCYRQDEILMLMRLAEDFNAKVDVFHHSVEAYRVAPEIKKHGAAAVVWSDWSSFKIESFNATTFNARLLMQAGIVTSLHSDDSQIATRMNWEAAKMLRNGLTEEEALALVTINTATVLGVNHRIGSLEPGKDADFVIWSDHPMSTKTRAEQTWIDGAKYFDIDEDRQLRAAIVEERSQLIQEILTN